MAGVRADGDDADVLADEPDDFDLGPVGPITVGALTPTATACVLANEPDDFDLGPVGSWTAATRAWADVVAARSRSSAEG